MDVSQSFNIKCRVHPTSVNNPHFTNSVGARTSPFTDVPTSQSMSCRVLPSVRLSIALLNNAAVPEAHRPAEQRSATAKSQMTHVARSRPLVCASPFSQDQRDRDSMATRNSALTVGLRTCWIDTWVGWISGIAQCLPVVSCSCFALALL